MQQRSPSKKPPVLCLMGPTACGKTDLAIALARHLPCEIISVDSTMVYRGMDIGTAKPSVTIRQNIPHHLIDIRDPAHAYSAGTFYTDVLHAIAAITARGRIPLLTGGTMLYFRILQQGLAAMPQADATLRNQLQERGDRLGWPRLHAELQSIDPQAAQRIQVNDKQRIQRALEVYALTGKTISAWQKDNAYALATYHLINLTVLPESRDQLHKRIQQRFQTMLEQGLIEEAEKLYARSDLNLEKPAMRSVGYKQIWMYLAGQINFETMQEQAVAATRQLAKRQITWLRSWPEKQCFSYNGRDLSGEIIQYVHSYF